MQSGSIGPALLRVPAHMATDLLSESLAPGRVFEADVVSVFGDRAILSMGRNIRMEVQLQAALKEGQRVRLQVQPREAGEAGAPILLKVLTAGDATALVRTDQQGAQGAEQAQAPAASQSASAPQVLWLPIPLPQGGQGWAQILVQEDAPRKDPTRSGQPVHQVRLWWETPALGAVQVAMDASNTTLTAIFTVGEAAARLDVEGALPDLQRRLTDAGFPEARLGTRQAQPGEPVGPLKVDDPGRLDRRM